MITYRHNLFKKHIVKFLFKKGANKMKIFAKRVTKVKEPKIYDKNRLFFEFLDKKQFENAEIDEENVYGEINLDKPFEGDYEEELQRRHIDVIKIADKKNDTARLYEVVETKKKHHKDAIGYIQTEIEVTKATDENAQVINSETDEKLLKTAFIRVMQGEILLIPIWVWWLLLLGSSAMVATAVAIGAKPELPVIILLAKSAFSKQIQIGLGVIGAIGALFSIKKIRQGKSDSLGRKLARLWNLIAVIITIVGVIYVPVKIIQQPTDNNQTQESQTGETKPSLEFADGQDWDGKLPERFNDQKDGSEYIEIAGYANLLVTADHQSIELINTAGNTVYQQYLVSFNGEQIFDSKLIAPGQQVEWNAFEQLPAGKNEVQFNIKTYDIATQAPCNGANQTVQIEVKK